MKLPHHNSSIISFKFQNSSLLLNVFSSPSLCLFTSNLKSLGKETGTNMQGKQLTALHFETVYWDSST